MTQAYVLYLTLVPTDRDGPRFGPRCQQAIRYFYNRARTNGCALAATGFVLGTGLDEGGFVGSFVIPLAELDSPTLVASASSWF